MSIGFFNQKEHSPKEAEVLEAVGPVLPVWQDLERWIREAFPVALFMYGKKYGWAMRFRVRTTLLTALYPTQNGFTVQVILNRVALQQASLLKLNISAKQAMDRANLYAEGKWLFIPVASPRDAADVKRLLKLKAEGGHQPVRRRPQDSLSRS